MIHLHNSETVIARLYRAGFHTISFQVIKTVSMHGLGQSVTTWVSGVPLVAKYSTDFCAIMYSLVPRLQLAFSPTCRVYASAIFTLFQYCLIYSAGSQTLLHAFNLIIIFTLFQILCSKGLKYPAHWSQSAIFIMVFSVPKRLQWNLW